MDSTQITLRIAQVFQDSLDAASAAFLVDHESVRTDPDLFLKMVDQEVTSRSKEEDREVSIRLLTHGIETLTEGFDENGAGVGEGIDGDGNEVEVDGRHTLSYLNTGDAYRTTVVFDHSTGQAMIGAWGDWVENRDAFLEPKQPDEQAPRPAPGF
jgi:hypothetical protein